MGGGGEPDLCIIIIPIQTRGPKSAKIRQNRRALSHVQLLLQYTRMYYAPNLLLQRQGIRRRKNHSRGVIPGLLALQLHQTHGVRFIQNLLLYFGPFLRESIKRKQERENTSGFVPGT